jgi:hypothetical protein
VERTFRRWLLVLSLVGGLHGLVYVPLIHDHTQTDSATYIAGAKALLHGTYTTPLASSFVPTPDGPVDRTLLKIPERAWSAPERQTFRTPAYPVLLAAVGAGAGGFSEKFVLGVQALLMGGCVWLVGATARRITGQRVALLAALLYAVDPYSKRYVALTLTEQLTAFFVLMTAYAFVRAWDSRAWHWWAGAGACAAAATLARPIFVVAAALVPLAAVLASGSGLVRLQRAAAATVAAGALLTPWLAWNASIVGRPTLTTFTEGWTLMDAAYGEGLDKTTSQVEAMPSFQRAVRSVHRFAPPTQVLLRDATAHPRYLYKADQELRRIALDKYGERLEAEPGTVLWEIVYRSYFIWMAHEDWYQPAGTALLLLRMFDWTLLALAVVGGALLAHRNRAGLALVVFLVAYTLFSALHHAEARFGIPVRGLYFIVVAVAVAGIWSRASEPWRNRARTAVESP